MNKLQSLIDRQSLIDATKKVRGHYDSFSRSTQILVIAGAVGLLFLAILESWRISDEWSAEADALVVQIDRAKNAKENVRASYRDRVQSLGNIRLPSAGINAFEAETRLFESVHTILADNAAEMIQIDVLPSANLPSGAVPEIRRGAQQKLGKIVVRAEFDCHQDNVTKIIREFENDPEIYTISRLQLNRYKDGQEEVRRLVDVEITVESWVLKTIVSRSTS